MIKKIKYMKKKKNMKSQNSIIFTSPNLKFAF